MNSLVIDVSYPSLFYLFLAETIRTLLRFIKLLSSFRLIHCSNVIMILIKICLVSQYFNERLFWKLFHAVWILGDTFSGCILIYESESMNLNTSNNLLKISLFLRLHFSLQDPNKSNNVKSLVSLTIS